MIHADALTANGTDDLSRRRPANSPAERPTHQQDARILSKSSQMMPLHGMTECSETLPLLFYPRVLYQQSQLTCSPPL